MAKATFPPGFRFHPTDVELACYYLKRKIIGKPLKFEGISEVELYKFAPWDLPEKSGMQTKDKVWYFFCAGGRKYANGLRKNRATDIGYWKTTGKDRSISYNSNAVAMKKTLIFHEGRAPNGVRTDWVMHEYRLVDSRMADTGFFQDAYVLCKIFQKSGPGPKNGEQYGAPFEEDWEDESVNDLSGLLGFTTSVNLPRQQLNLPDDGLRSDTNNVGNLPDSSPSPEYFDAHRLLKELSEENKNNPFVPQANSGGQVTDVANEVNIDVLNEIYGGLEDISTKFNLNSASVEGLALQHTLLELANQAEKACNGMHSLTERSLNEVQLGAKSGSYMEIKDLFFPVEGHRSDLVDRGDVFAQETFRDWSGDAVLAFLGGTDICGVGGSCDNAGRQFIADYSCSGEFQAIDEVDSTRPIHASAGGEKLKLLSESPIGDDDVSRTTLRHLFSSIPGRPAIAAEYPSTLERKSFVGGVSYYGSSIHVKAEVTFQCCCNGDAHPSAGLACSTDKQVPSWKVARGSRSSSSGFTFVFFLGVLSALMWIFLFTLGIKLGKCAWQLLSS